MARTRRHAVAIGIAIALALPVGLSAVLAVPAAHRGLDSRHWTLGHDQAWVAPGPAGQVKPVRITGSVRGTLSPGASAPIPLTFANPNRDDVTLHRVHVHIISIAAPAADAAHPCTRLDFELRQMPRLTIRLRPGQVTSLSRLLRPQSSWPRLAMRNRPVNQDGCKGARLTLGYRAHGVQWQ